MIDLRTFCVFLSVQSGPILCALSITASGISRSGTSSIKPFTNLKTSSAFSLFCFGRRFFLCARPYDQKIGSSLIYCFPLYTTIIRQSQGSLLLFYLFFSQMCQYFVCYIHGRYCPYISITLFLAALPLYFISSAVFIEVLPISFVHHIHWGELLFYFVHYIPWLYEVLPNIWRTFNSTNTSC